MSPKAPEYSLMMSDEKVADVMFANLKFAEELANKLFSATGNDGKDAFPKRSKGGHRRQAAWNAHRVSQDARHG
jgi:hypothetical protein